MQIKLGSLNETWILFKINIYWLISQLNEQKKNIFKTGSFNKTNTAPIPQWHSNEGFQKIIATTVKNKTERIQVYLNTRLNINSWFLCHQSL